jgi:hypothetical protein
MKRAEYDAGGRVELITALISVSAGIASLLQKPNLLRRSNPFAKNAPSAIPVQKVGSDADR